jgi:hypothetical protein
MKLKKIFFLFFALLLPICIFLFLRIFGKNEFVVDPLYDDVYPQGIQECGIEITLPYRIPDSVRAELKLQEKSFTLIYVGELTSDSEKQLNRVRKVHGNEVKLEILPSSDNSLRMKRCIFFLQDPYDLVLVNPAGIIHGQYVSTDREEIDRLLTELTILFKRY